jgi:DNA-binding NarL/FixJ family response regulator
MRYPNAVGGSRELQAERESPTVGVVAVVDSVALYRLGISSSLRDLGFEVEEPADVLAWAFEDDHSIVVMTLRTPEDWDRLVKLKAVHPAAAAVVIVPGLRRETYRRALSSGAGNVLPEHAAVDEILDAVLASAQRKTVLPAEVAQSFANGHGSDPDPSPVEPREVEWIRALASGLTVAGLAHKVGYSEREMYRLLRRLYHRLGCESRSGALVAAAQLGLI